MITEKIAFNLLVNTSLSFLAGLAVVAFFIWLFKIQNSGWKLYLLSLPFVKIISDLLMGIPADSIIYTHYNPFSFPAKSQMLVIGAGMSRFGLRILEVLFLTTSPEGVRYNISVGDYLMYWLSNKHLYLPMLICILLLIVSCILIVRRIVTYFLFHRRFVERLSSAILIEEITLKLRKVQVYRSSVYKGSPFTGGFFKPYILIPEVAYQQLSSDELQSVIKHELAHIKHFDLFFNLIILTLGDLFWFIPGYRTLSRKLEDLREILADKKAVILGSSQVLLANALIKIQELSIEESESHGCYSALFKKTSLIKTRIQLLLGQTQKVGRWGWQLKMLGYVYSTVITVFVLNSTLGGNNHEQRTVMSIEEFKDWLAE